jgi:hypothetical protein
MAKYCFLDQFKGKSNAARANSLAESQKKTDLTFNMKVKLPVSLRPISRPPGFGLKTDFPDTC